MTRTVSKVYTMLRTMSKVVLCVGNNISSTMLRRSSPRLYNATEITCPIICWGSCPRLYYGREIRRVQYYVIDTMHKVILCWGPCTRLYYAAEITCPRLYYVQFYAEDNVQGYTMYKIQEIRCPRLYHVEEITCKKLYYAEDQVTPTVLWAPIGKIFIIW